MARALRSPERDLHIRPSDFIGRFGVEEFAAVLCKGVDVSERSWLEFGPALANATAVIDGNALAATAGIGLAASERLPVDPTDLFAQADCAAVSRQRNAEPH